MQTNIQLDSRSFRHSDCKRKDTYTIYTHKDIAVSNLSDQRNWRGIFISLLVIIAVLSLILFSIILISPPNSFLRRKHYKPKYEDLHLYNIHIARFNGTWISDSEFIFQSTYGEICLYNVITLTSLVLVSNLTMRQFNAEEFKISIDLKFILLLSDIKRSSIYTKLAKYFVIEIPDKNNFPLTPFVNNNESIKVLLQYAVWSPTDLSVAFVYNNNIYFKKHVCDKLSYQITSTGEPNVIFNGVPDWLYENEIMQSDSAMWFSNDGKFLLFLMFNDSLVQEYLFNSFSTKKYPSMESIRYPKVETTNPIVTVYVVNLTDENNLRPNVINFDNFISDEFYITNIIWNEKDNIEIELLNRFQNQTILVICERLYFQCTDVIISCVLNLSLIYFIFYTLLIGN